MSTPAGEKTPLGQGEVRKYGGTIVRDFSVDMDSSRHVLLVHGGSAKPLETETGSGDWAQAEGGGKSCGPCSSLQARAASLWHDKRKLTALTLASSSLILMLLLLSPMALQNRQSKNDLEESAWSSIAIPYSTVSPASLGFVVVDRPQSSSPGPAFRNLINRQIPLPTNSWCENFFLGNSNMGPDNKVRL